MTFYAKLLSKLPHKHGKALICSCNEKLSIVGNGELHCTEKTRLEENCKKFLLSNIHSKKLVNFFKNRNYSKKEMSHCPKKREVQDSPVKKILLNYSPTLHTNCKILSMFLSFFCNTPVCS